jgi:hypothetical protein
VRGEWGLCEGSGRCEWVVGVQGARSRGAALPLAAKDL